MPPAILAAIEPADHGQLLLLILAGLFALVAALDRGFAIFHRFKKVPAPDEVFATKKELSDYRAATDHRLEAMESSFARGLRDLQHTLETELRAVNRSLGRLEGQIQASGHIPNQH
jgi:hypothetical protein